MKNIIANNAILALQNFELLFELYYDARDYQLGAVTLENNKQIAFSGRKQNSILRWFTTMEKELLIDNKTPTEFK